MVSSGRGVIHHALSLADARWGVMVNVFSRNRSWHHPVGVCFITPCSSVAPLAGRDESRPYEIADKIYNIAMPW